jgi:hypothetical protein
MSHSRYVLESDLLQARLRLPLVNVWRVTTSRWLELASYQFLVPLLLRDGVDIGDREVRRPLPRGVPAYVLDDADLIRVQRNMARGLIRTCFVLRNGQVVGALELRDLARQAESVVESALSA